MKATEYRERMGERDDEGRVVEAASATRTSERNESQATYRDHTVPSRFDGSMPHGSRSQATTRRTMVVLCARKQASQ